MNSSDFCEKLIKTYNASILKKLPVELQQSFFEAATDCLEKIKKEERTVLATLITNWIDKNTKVSPTLPIVGFIEGPLNISLHWSKRFQKLIYNIGELHIGTKLCPPGAKNSTSKIEDYLIDWFKKPTAYTDFYLEIGSFVLPEGYTIKFGGQKTIDILRTKFNSCINKLTRDTILECNTSRMHFFDIRQGNVKGKSPSILLFIIKIKEILEKMNTKFFSTKNERCYGYEKYSDIFHFHGKFDECKDTELTDLIYDFCDNSENIDMLNQLLEFNQQEYKEFWYEQLYSFEIIKKEVDRMDEDVRPYLIFFIKRKLDKYIDKDKEKEKIEVILSELLNICDENSDKSFDITFDTLIKFYDQLFDFVIYTTELFGLFADAYLLARIFKTFQINDPEKRRLVDEPSEPHNIIIYAGSNHSNNYREFLEFIGFKTLEKSGEGFNNDYVNLTYNKCININYPKYPETKSISQPLFNNWPSDDDEEDKLKKIDTKKLKIYESFETTFNIKPKSKEKRKATHDSSLFEIKRNRS